MYPVFVYLPAEPDKDGRWINLSLVCDVWQRPEGKLKLYGACGEEIAVISGEQAKHLRAALDNQTRPQTLAEKYPALSAWAERREPQLPNLPDPVVVPPAVHEFEEKVSARDGGVMEILILKDSLLYRIDGVDQNNLIWLQNHVAPESANASLVEVQAFYNQEAEISEISDVGNLELAPVQEILSTLQNALDHDSPALREREHRKHFSTFPRIQTCTGEDAE